VITLRKRMTDRHTIPRRNTMMRTCITLLVSVCVVGMATVVKGVQGQRQDHPLNAPIPQGVPEDPQSKFLVKLVRRCGTVAPDDHRRAALHLRTLPFRAANLRAMAATPTTVPVYFHVIYNGTTGNVTDDQIKRQIQVMNDDYKPHGFQFALKATSRTDVSDPSVNKPGWFNMQVNSADELDAKTTLGVNPAQNLNLYTAAPTDPLVGTLLGFSTFPWEFAGNPKRDGVVVLHSSLPGGQAPFDQGKTATHEVGHWLGLYHTFQGGCVPPGDEVDDTQPQPDGDNIFQCDPSANTCSGGDPSKAPIHNYMNYADDSCLTEFTSGQRDRMKVEVSLYRTLLVHPDARRNLRTFASH
jgi:hypothetical protein